MKKKKEKVEKKKKKEKRKKSRKEEKERKKKKEKKNLKWVPIVISLIVIILTIFLSRIYIDKRTPISITFINVENCSTCYNMTEVIEELEKLGAKTKVKEYIYPINKESKVTQKLDSLLKKYDIQKIPALILEAPANKIKMNRSGVFPEFMTYPQIVEFLKILKLRKKGLKVIVEAPEPIYYNLSSKQLEGFVNVIEIKAPNCKRCNNMTKFREWLPHRCVVEKYLSADYNTELAQQLIEKYNIKRLPAVVLDPDAGLYELLKEEWGSFGTIEEDGYFIARNITIPFYDVDDGKIKGIVDITYIYDPLCEDCYNYSLHRETLKRFGVIIGKETVLPRYAPEAAILMNKYNIIAVPTFIASPDLKYYPALMKIWNQVGTIEEDGYFVFRNMEKMPERIYIDTQTNKKVVGG